MHLGSYMNHIADAWTSIFQMVGPTRGTPGGFQASGSGEPPRHLRHLILRKCLPLKLSCFARLFKGSKLSNSSKMSTIPINLKLLGIGISWEISPLYSTWRMSPWMRTLGFAQSSPSSLYFWYHVLRQIRPTLPRNNFAVLLVFGEIITKLCSRLITLSPGMNSRMHSEPIIFQKGLWKEIWTNF